MKDTVYNYYISTSALHSSTLGVQKYSTVSVQIAAETIVGVGPLSDVVSNMTFQDCKPLVMCMCTPLHAYTQINNYFI